MNNLTEAVSELNNLINRCKILRNHPPVEHDTLQSGINPFTYFEQTLLKTVDLIMLENSELSNPQNPSDTDFRISIKSGTKRILVDYRTIRYAKGLKDYSTLYTNDKKYFVKGSLKVLENLLPKTHFARVHKSFIIPVSDIKSYYKNKLSVGSVVIPVGRNFKQKVNSFFESV